MEIKYASSNTQDDIEWLIGKEYKLDTSNLAVNPTLLRLTMIGLLVAFGLSQS